MPTKQELLDLVSLVDAKAVAFREAIHQLEVFGDSCACTSGVGSPLSDVKRLGMAANSLLTNRRAFVIQPVGAKRTAIHVSSALTLDDATVVCDQLGIE